MDNETFRFVTGTFTAPLPSGRSGTAASAWVGINGASATCTGGGLLQTGADFFPDGKGGASYDAWYDWYPDYSYYFSGLSISSGDVIRANITALSPTSGIATVENLTNGQFGQKHINSTYALCREDAEWIVEDFEDNNNNMLPFADFGTITLKDAVVTGTGT